MATQTASSNPTAQRNYAAQLAVSAAVVQAIRALWASVSPLSSKRAMETFGNAAQVVVAQWSQASVSIAADHYLAARAEAGVPGQPKLPPMPPAPAAKVAKELGWIEQQRTQIELEAEQIVADLEARILAEATEAFEKVVADEARQYTVDAVVGDEKALGFRRVARPEACPWCLALAVRKSSRKGRASDHLSESGRAKSSRRGNAIGHDPDAEHWGVYKSRAFAGQMPAGAAQLNRFHHNCHCTVEPVFSLDFRPPKWLQDRADMYADSDDFNHFRRRLAAERGVTKGGRPKSAPAPIPAPQRDITDVLAALDAAMRPAR